MTTMTTMTMTTTMMIHLIYHVCDVVEGFDS